MELNLKKFTRRDYVTGSEETFISLRPSGTISFNSKFVKEAELGTKHKRVTIFTDPKNRVIAFDFHSNKNEKSSYALYKDRGNSLNVSAVLLFKHNKWIDAVAKEDDPLLRRFKPEYNRINKKWFICLAPSFEIKTKDISEIPHNIEGVYRYIRKGEIVYIGKGNIKSRTGSLERENWDFDTIEYSIIEDPEKRSYWENYWLNMFQEKEGRLPLYNKISGEKNK